MIIFGIVPLEQCFDLGGKLKTLAEQDEESLQAAFYDIDTVFNNELVLR